MKRNEILETLRNLSEQIEREYKAHVEGIFGSCAREEQGEHSDLDVLVKFGEEATLYDLVGLGQFLEDVFGFHVDVVSTRALREEIKASVIRDLVAL